MRYGPRKYWGVSPAAFAGFSVNFDAVEIHVLTSDGHPVQGAVIKLNGKFERLFAKCGAGGVSMPCWASDQDEVSKFNQSVVTGRDGRARLQARKSSALSPTKRFGNMDIQFASIQQGKAADGVID